MLALSAAEYYLLGVIAVALVLFISNRLAPDLVALLVLLALGLSGIVTPAEALMGFGSGAVITIMGLFVLTAALERTGAVAWVAEWLARIGGKTEARLLLVLMGAGALLSLVMNNIAAGAVLLPAAVRVGQQASILPSKILMPLAYGTLVGGMATIYTTANILISGMLAAQGFRSLTLLDFLPTGGVVVLAGMVYMVLVGRHLLPERLPLVEVARQYEPDLQATYHLDERLWEARLAPDSPLVGDTLAACGFGSDLGITVLALWHGGTAHTDIAPDTVVQADDVLLVLGREERVSQLEPLGMHIEHASEHVHDLTNRSILPAEVIVAPRSPAVGATLSELQFRSRSGLQVVAIWRGGRSYRTDVGKMRLQAGDALLVQGHEERLQALGRDTGYIIPHLAHAHRPDLREGVLATGITVLVIGAAATGLVATPVAMLAGVALLVLAGLLRMEEVYQAIEWRVIFLIAGMTPLSIAIQESGLATRVGGVFVATVASYGPLALIAALYLFTMLIGQVLGGQVTALVVGPFAITAALQAGVDPVAVGVAVAIACSASFLTPIAHPVNLLMMNPGGYTPADFWRVGVGMALVCFLALLGGMVVFWGV